MPKQNIKEIHSERSTRLGTYGGRFTSLADQQGISPEFWNSEHSQAMIELPRLEGLKFLPAQKKKDFHSFSRDLAKKLNPKQPDLTAATMLQGLYFWEHTGRKAKFKLPPRVSCYRTLSELKGDHPYFERSTIHSALQRARKVLQPSFTFTGTSKRLEFFLSQQLVDEISGSQQLRFRVSDAEAYGILEAVLIANLTWQTEEAVPMMHAGKAHYPLSPTTLSRSDQGRESGSILPASRSTISRALKKLTDLGAIVRHPKERSHFALAASEIAIERPIFPKASISDSNVSEVAGVAPISDDLLCVDSNEIENGVIKAYMTKAAHASRGPAFEENLKNYKQVVDKQFAEHLLASKENPPITEYVRPDELPYDVIMSPYADVFIDEVYTDRFAERVKEKMEEDEGWWRDSKWKVTSEDLKLLKRLYYTIPTLVEYDLSELINGYDHLAQEWDQFPEGAYDPYYFSRRVRSAAAFFKYMPKLIREACPNVRFTDGEPDSLSDLEEPYCSLWRFFDGKTLSGVDFIV